MVFMLRGLSVCENGDCFRFVLFVGAFLDNRAATMLKTHDCLAQPHVSISMLFLCDLQCPSYSDFLKCFRYTSGDIFQFLGDISGPV